MYKPVNERIIDRDVRRPEHGWTLEAGMDQRSKPEDGVAGLVLGDVDEQEAPTKIGSISKTKQYVHVF